MIAAQLKIVLRIELRRFDLAQCDVGFDFLARERETHGAFRLPVRRFNQEPEGSTAAGRTTPLPYKTAFDGVIRPAAKGREEQEKTRNGELSHASQHSSRDTLVQPAGATRSNPRLVRYNFSRYLEMRWATMSNLGAAACSNSTLSRTSKYGNRACLLRFILEASCCIHRSLVTNSPPASVEAILVPEITRMLPRRVRFGSNATRQY